MPVYVVNVTFTAINFAIHSADCIGGFYLARDDFSESVKKMLAARVGYICSNPECMARTLGPSVGDANRSVNIGEAAHITAASPGGPRYNKNLSSQQRASLTNGIWLCRNCAATIDKDPGYYTVDMLYQWKDQAEKHASESLGVLGRTSQSLIGNDASFISELLTTPPFAVAFEQEPVPEYYFNINYRDIPIDWESTWVDAVRVRTTVVNKSSNYEIVIDGLSIEYESFDNEYLSAVQYIAQGVSYAIEFVYNLGEPIIKIAHINRSFDSVELLDDAFFANGGRITVPPGSSETIICSFVTTGGHYAFRPSFNALIEGERKSIPIFYGHSLKVISSGEIPSSGKQWTIHLDGRARGMGFRQDNLGRFGNLLMLERRASD